MSFAFYVWTENTSAQIAFGDSPRSLKKDYDPASVDRRWLVSANWVNVEKTISSFVSTLIYTFIYT